MPFLVLKKTPINGKEIFSGGGLFSCAKKKPACPRCSWRLRREQVFYRLWRLTINGVSKTRRHFIVSVLCRQLVNIY